MTAGGFDMRSLLERAGFQLRGPTRADCAHCEGHSRGTVAFTIQVAFCHRCKWRANSVTLARELGLLQGHPQTVSVFREEAQRRARLEAEVSPFEVWREARIREVSARYRLLSKTNTCAAEVVVKFPDCDEAWDALARFYHAEAKLSSAFDWLTFTKASAWLEKDSTPLEVFETWRRHAA
jgi:hypothetical protein